MSNDVKAKGVTKVDVEDLLTSSCLMNKHLDNTAFSTRALLDCHWNCSNTKRLQGISKQCSLRVQV